MSRPGASWRCQAPGCRGLPVRAVEIELPESWGAERQHTALTVTVGLCRRHGHEVSRRASALLEARAEHAAMRAQIEAMERDLVEAEGALAYQRERAGHAERALAELCREAGGGERAGEAAA